MTMSMLDILMERIRALHMENIEVAYLPISRQEAYLLNRDDRFARIALFHGSILDPRDRDEIRVDGVRIVVLL